MNRLRLVMSLVFLLALTVAASAQGWPTRRIQILVPFPAGGSGDIQVRMVAEELAKALGQPVIVENKPGANGNIASAEVARAPADGYTLLLGSVGTHAINVSLYSKLQYDPVKEFVPLSLVTVFPQLIVPGIQFKGKTLADLIASLKAEAGRASYGSSSTGSPTHLAGELFKLDTGADIIHVPYRGQGPAINDMLGGRLQVMFPSVPDALPFITGGKLRAVAIMSERRAKVLPDVPTTAEAGHPKLVGSFWAGLYTTAGTPRPVLERLNRELVKIIGSPAFAGRVEPLGFEARPTTLEEFAAFNATEIKRWGDIIRAHGIRVEQ
jgi:tripartite-type tricarboxylate transporter receptor subunit TctC